jgi:hypothetical protein
MSKYRIAQFFILSGTNGTGKTTMLVNFFKINRRNLIFPANLHDKAFRKYKKVKPKFKWVTDPKDYNGKRKIKKWYIPNLNKFTGTYVVDVSEMELMDEDPRQVFDYVCKFMRNGGLFVDDFKNYVHSAGNTTNTFTKVFRDRRHRELDIFLASHSMSDINRELLKFKPTFLIFNITEPLSDTVKKKIVNNKELDACIKRVQTAYYNGDKYYCEMFSPNAPSL